MRDITSPFRTALDSPVVYPAFFLKMDTKAGMVLAWTGHGPFTFESEIYLGVGKFGGMSEIDEDRDLSAQTVEVQLDGVPADMVSMGLQSIGRFRRAKIWFALFNSNYQLIGAKQILDSYTDVPKFKESPEQLSLAVVLENINADADRPRMFEWTADTQSIFNPKDKGFDYVPRLQERDLIFGRS